jgi:hypothetical protein
MEIFVASDRENRLEGGVLGAGCWVLGAGGEVIPRDPANTPRHSDINHR